jgi:uncharacterized membrane protein
MSSRELAKDGASKKDKKAPDVVLPDSIKTLIDKANIPKEEKARIAIQIASYFRGPLPPPDILEAYNQIVDGGAERIFRKFEEQSEHRMNLERLAIGEELKQSKRGQIFGFIVALFGLSLAAFMAYLGHEAFASILGGGTILSLVTVFVVGKVKQHTQIKKKSEV